MVPAPERFSITTCCPMSSLSFGAMVRAVMSVPPPGEEGTTSLTGRVGYALCACTISDAANENAKDTSASTALLYVIATTPPGCFVLCRFDAADRRARVPAFHHHDAVPIRISAHDDVQEVGTRQHAHLLV